MIKMNRYIIALLLIPVAAALVSLVGISIIISSSNRHIFTTVQEVPNAEAALILGAAILRSGKLSPVLKDRVDQAIELYEAGKVKQIIASGNHASVDYNEVEPIETYLLDAGIPQSDIILDRAGFDTYSSIYRARDVFHMRSLAIVSQSFHLPRAVFIARKLGLEASGVSADRGHYKLVNYFREMLADVKAVMNLVSRREPRSLEKNPSVSEVPGVESRQLFPVW